MLLESWTGETLYRTCEDSFVGVLTMHLGCVTIYDMAVRHISVPMRVLDILHEHMCAYGSVHHIFHMYLRLD